MGSNVAIIGDVVQSYAGATESLIWMGVASRVILGFGPRRINDHHISQQMTSRYRHHR
jgi:hypothetical protein